MRNMENNDNNNKKQGKIMEQIKDFWANKKSRYLVFVFLAFVAVSVIQIALRFSA